MQQICSAEEKEKFDTGIQHGLTIIITNLRFEILNGKQIDLDLGLVLKKNMYFFFSFKIVNID